MSTTKIFLTSVLMLLFCSSFLVSPTKKNNEYSWYTSQYENVMGTSMDVSVKSTNEMLAEQATAIMIAEIKRLSTILSAYQSQSELSRWIKTRGKPVKVSNELMEVLQLFDYWHQQTGGAIEAGYEEAAIVWKNAAKQQKMPGKADLATAISNMQQQHWNLDSVNGTATHLTDVPLVLNTFTKSYIIQKAVAAAKKSSGVQSVSLNIGGDVFVSGADAVALPVTNPFHAAGNDEPLLTLSVSNKAVATSGNYRRGVNILGKWYTHIIDPRTGWPVDNIVSATVVASDAVIAGAMATAFTILSPEQSKQLAAQYPGVEFLLVDKNGKIFASENWSGAMPGSNPKPKGQVMIADQGWNKGHQLQIDLEIARISEQFVHRPFVAVWVEDANHKPVKLLSVWYNKPKWLRDLREFYKNYGANFSPGAMAMSAAAGATRSAGKYSLVWDGKDEAGNYVPAGVYTIQIEAAREHGTYQIMSGAIECGKKLATVTLAGNIEIAAASLSYVKAEK
ncbi:MAG: DUF2271 domain-containing protein [Chitinophagia bacterium]|jgi:thiamine biosynthesis lipoprotein ApbE